MVVDVKWRYLTEFVPKNHEHRIQKLKNLLESQTFVNQDYLPTLSSRVVLFLKFLSLGIHGREDAFLHIPL